MEPGETAPELKSTPTFSCIATGRKPSKISTLAAGRMSYGKSTHAWKIARRKIILDQNVLLAKNVSIFF